MNEFVNDLVNPAAQMALMAQMVRIGFELQLVIGMRVAGMFGLVRQSPGEPIRMVAEKQEAVTELIQAALRAAGRGAGPHGVMSAALRPYGRRTSANSRRLSRIK